MSNNPFPQRKSPRLQGYDYSQSGAYFVTICTHQRSNFFGQIVNDVMHLNSWGGVAEDSWAQIPDHFPTVELDVYVVMPNHVHGILILDDVPTQKAPTLGVVVGSYKAAVTRAINRQGLNPEQWRIWQERYHDHIIRSDKTLSTLREYVANNPARWHEDKFYME